MKLPTINKISAAMSLGGIMAFMAMAPSVHAQTTTTTTWTNCSNEWATCTIPGTRQVRYGANGKYATKTFTNSVQCNNNTFGDPAPGVPKKCDYATTTTTTAPPVVTTPPTTTTPTPPVTAPGSRDAYKSPFASNSIWNMPIGSGAHNFIRILFFPVSNF